MKTIIGFDSWTRGSHHFERLVPTLRKMGFDLVLIHIGSWGHDKGRPKEEYFGKLLARDISYYGRGSFDDVLVCEKPVAAMFLSTSAWPHRAFNRYCKKFDIPTLHLYHGLVNVQSVTSQRSHPINWRSQFAHIYTRSMDNLFRVIPVYIASLFKTRATFKDCTWFGKELWLKIVGRSYMGVAAPDSSTTVCCVYAAADIEHAVHRYRIKRKNVFAVGNPDLVAFGLEEQDIGSQCSNSRKSNSEILYIDTALVEAGAVYDNAGDFVSHLNFTKQNLAQQGYELVVKLHPAHSRTDVPELLRKQGIGLCEKDEFISRLKSSAAAIVEPSTAAILPAMIGIPMLLAQYNKLQDQKYGVVLTSYPRARPLKHIEGTNRLLEEIVELDNSEQNHAWLIKNSGPLPAEKMPDRVAVIIADLVNANGPASL